MKDLIAKLESATGGSMALSREVARAIGWINRGNSRRGEWFHPDDVRDGKPVLDSLHGTEVHREPPDYTRSVDVAMALVRDGFMIHLNIRHGEDGGAEAVVGTDWDTNKPWFKAFDNGEMDHEHTPALALCIAALKARAE